MAVLRLWCRVSGELPSSNQTDTLPSMRVLWGPLRGTLLTIPAVERLSYALGVYEPHVVAELRRYLKQGAVSYDIGANAGYHSLIMAKWVGSHGKVVAFEPDPRNARALASNALRQPHSVIEVVQEAVGASIGTVQLATFTYSLVSHIATEDTPTDAVIVPVDCTTLDDFVFVRHHPIPTLIKIDVEGGEAGVFEGARQLLDEVRPVIIAEVRSTAWPRVRAAIEPFGYKGRALTGESNWMSRYHVADLLLTPG